MSKQRARRREARLAEAEAQRLARAAQAEHRRQALARQQRRAHYWRRLRLWQRGPQHGRERERWTALVVLLMLAVMLTWIVTRSFKDILIAALICFVALPLLIAVVVNRERR